MGYLLQLWDRGVTLGFHLLYHQFAFAYDMVSYLVSLGDWRAWQRSALTFLPDTPSLKILEIAHGTGNLQLDLAQTSHHVYGCDLSAYMGRITCSKLQRANHLPSLVTADVMVLPFARQSFDVIISTFPTNFIIQPQTLAQLHRTLVDDGRVIVVPNGMLTGGGVLRWLLEFAYRITGQRESVTFDLPEHFATNGFTFQRHTLPHRYSESETWVLSKIPILTARVIS